MSKQIVIDEQQSALNVYENIIYFSFQDITTAIPDTGEFQQDTFAKLSPDMPLQLHCACIATIFSRNPELREVFDVAIAMSYNNDQKQN